MSRIDLDAYLVPRTPREKRLAQTVVYVRKIALARRDIANGWRVRALAAEARAERLQGVLQRLYPTDTPVPPSTPSVNKPADTINTKGELE